MTELILFSAILGYSYLSRKMSATLSAYIAYWKLHPESTRLAPYWDGFVISSVDISKLNALKGLERGEFFSEYIAAISR